MDNIYTDHIWLYKVTDEPWPTALWIKPIGVVEVDGNQQMAQYHGQDWWTAWLDANYPSVEGRWN